MLRRRPNSTLFPYTTSSDLEEVRGDGACKATAREQREVDECEATATACVRDEQRHEGEPGAPGRDGAGVQPALVAGIRHAVEEEGDSRREERKAAQVEPPAELGFRLRQESQRCD